MRFLIYPPFIAFLIIIWFSVAVLTALGKAFNMRHPEPACQQSSNASTRPSTRPSPAPVIAGASGPFGKACLLIELRAARLSSATSRKISAAGCWRAICRQKRARPQSAMPRRRKSASLASSIISQTGPDRRARQKNRRVARPAWHVPVWAARWPTPSPASRKSRAGQQAVQPGFLGFSG